MASTWECSAFCCCFSPVRFSDVEVEIELVEDEAPFLSGQTKMSISMSPVKIVKNPDGSLQRSAQTQSALAKERRELRQAQREAEMDSIPKDVGKLYIDPMPEGELMDCSFYFFVFVCSCMFNILVCKTRRRSKTGGLLLCTVKTL